MFVEDMAFETVKRWCSQFTHNQLVEQIKMCEKILESNNASEFVFFDDVALLYEILRDECMKRIVDLSCM